METLPILMVVSLPSVIDGFLTHSKELIDNGQFFQFLLQWPVLALFAAWLIVGFLRKSKAPVVLTLAVYAIGLLMHMTKVGQLSPGGDPDAMVSSAGQIALSTGGVFVVVIVVIYMLIIKD
ncbi:MAG: hypothetical protein P9M14_10395 [Candidatus Alcyoniella australis]|nr:hypothetical protein [Candidatus Alcyoniella australis]